MHRPLKALVDGEWVELGEKELDGKGIVFKFFGHGIYWTNVGTEIEAARKVHFDMVEVEIVFLEYRISLQGI